MGLLQNNYSNKDHNPMIFESFLLHLMIET